MTVRIDFTGYPVNECFRMAALEQLRREKQKKS